MSKEINKKSVVSSFVWKFLQNSGSQGILLVISIILARLLSPEAYGIIALTAIFLRISNAVILGGFNMSLIQKKNIDEIDLSSVMFLSLTVAAVFYILIFIFAPNIASFYNEPLLSNVLRVLGINLFLYAFNSIQNVIVSRKMQFKKLFIASMFSISISAAAGIYMAYSGYGVWALVVQQILAQIVMNSVLFITLRWKPKLVFSINRIKILFSYGSKLLISNLMDTVYNELRSMIIGKMYNSSILGYYNKGKKFPQQIISSVDGTIQSVMFPTMSAHQEDLSKVKKLVRRSIMTSTYVVFPLMVGMAVVARPLVSVLLTDKWLPSVPYLQIFCAAFALWPIHTTNLQAIKALGRSDIYLKLALVKKIIGIAAFAISIPFGVLYIALSVPLTGLIGAWINAYPNKKLLNYSFSEQIKDIFPALALSIVMGLSVLAVSLLGLSDFLTLIIQVLLGIALYSGLSMLLKVKSFYYLLDVIKGLYERLRGRKVQN